MVNADTTNHKSVITRRGIQIALGCLWFLDGLLQLQPKMFTSNFATGVIAPAAQGQPWVISAPMHFFMSVFLFLPALSNAGIAITQLGLGALILWKRTAKIGLLLSIAWGLFVWVVGEGISGLASGHAMLLMGLPGAALIYALLALGVLPKPGRDQRPAYWLLIAWIVLWSVGSIYQLLPGQNTVADNSAMITSNATSAPHWMASIDTAVANYLNRFGTATTPSTNSMAGMPGMGVYSAPSVSSKAAASTHPVSGFWFLFLIALLQLIIAFLVIIPGFIRKLAILLGGLLSIVFWVVGQSMGSYFSGLATDPNTGPLLILLGITVLACTHRDAQVRAFFGRIKESFLSNMRAFNDA